MFALRIPLFIIAVLGLLVSGYLYITYTTGAPIVCTGGAGCDTVRASAYATILGLPTPAHGIIFYLILAVAALLSTPQNASWMRLPLALITGVGVAVSGWLTYLEAFVIEAWCLWCVASALLTVLAFVLVWYTLPQYGNH